MFRRSLLLSDAVAKRPKLRGGNYPLGMSREQFKRMRSSPTGRKPWRHHADLEDADITTSFITDTPSVTATRSAAAAFTADPAAGTLGGASDREILRALNQGRARAPAQMIGSTFDL